MLLFAGTMYLSFHAATAHAHSEALPQLQYSTLAVTAQSAGNMAVAQEEEPTITPHSGIGPVEVVMAVVLLCTMVIFGAVLVRIYKNLDHS